MSTDTFSIFIGLEVKNEDPDKRWVRKNVVSKRARSSNQDAEKKCSGVELISTRKVESYRNKYKMV
jgi:hypothetical protein